MTHFKDQNFKMKMKYNYFELSLKKVSKCKKSKHKVISCNKKILLTSDLSGSSGK